MENQDHIQPDTEQLEQIESADLAENVENTLETPANEAEKAHLAQIETLTAQVQEYKDKFMRNFAEFDNYKKRALREKIDLMQTAARDTLSALLPVLDDFDRAAKNETFTDGVQLLFQKLQNIVRAKGLTEMESNGAAFDAELHEAITEIPAPTDELKGKVVDTVEKGYFLNDKLIRHAKVVVGK